MKFRSLFILLITITLILAPAAALDFSSDNAENEQSEKEKISEKTTKSQKEASSEKASEENNSNKVKLLRKGSGKLEEIELEEYVAGAVAAEMPAAWHEEALKAQAVACRTNAVYSREHPDSSLNGADISDYAGSHQGYLDEGQRKEKWGEAFEENEKICRAAVNATSGKIMRYKEKTAFAAFHAISCGMTESAKNVWGNDLAYLRPVNSAGDMLSPDYDSRISVPIKEFNEKLAALDCKIKNNKLELGKITLTQSGYVEQAVLGGKEISGIKIRELFELPSAAFTLKITDDEAVFECRGLGHGVGMSQFGAQTMAQQGSTWEEILNHYYDSKPEIYDLNVVNG